MAKAKKGDRVQVHYTGTLDNGSIFDSSGGSGFVIYAPLEFALGQGDLLPKCQEAIVGLEPGQSVQVRVACRDAYGPRDASLVFVTQRSELNPKEEHTESWRYPNGRKQLRFTPKKGDLMEICLPDGDTLPVVVIEVGADSVTLDANHPLAGQDLNFDIKLVNLL
jgi:peptidylprolyl isomerase